MTWLVRMRARRRGAIGVFYDVTVRSQADTEDGAIDDARRFWEVLAVYHVGPDGHYDALLRGACEASETIDADELEEGRR